MVARVSSTVVWTRITERLGALSRAHVIAERTSSQAMVSSLGLEPEAISANEIPSWSAVWDYPSWSRTSLIQPKAPMAAG